MPNRSLSHFFLTSISAFISIWSLTSFAQSEKKLVLYTHRNEQLIQPLLAEYKKQTGVQIELLTGQPGPLLERIKAEGEGSPADLLISVDAGSLWLADKEGIFETINSKTLNEKIPAHLRSPTGTWYGLSLRARTIFFNNKKVKATELSTYDDLAQAKWKGRLCMRSSKQVYTQSLVALLIAEKGEKETSQIVQGWVNNMATSVFESDSKMLEAVNQGDCDVTIANTYYFARLTREGKVPNVSLHFPPNTHMNVSGGGVLKTSKRKKEAIAFLEWLTTNTAQKLFADSNMEYPVITEVQPDPIVVSFGSPKASNLPLIKAGELQRSANLILEKAKYR